MQGDQGAVHDPEGSRIDPGMQNASHPQNVGQPSQEAGPRMGQTNQEIYTQECEAANTYMLAMIDCQMSQMRKTQSQARIIAGVHRPNYRRTNDHKRCTMGTKASIKIAALNIRGMGNMNTWHPDNKWNHVNQVMNTKHIAIMVVGEAHLNNE